MIRKIKSIVSYIENLSDRQKTALTLGLALICYFPFIFYGFGGDSDSHAVGRTAERLINELQYQPSRYPGYFTHEAFSSLLYFLGGSVGTNFGTLIMSLIAIYFFLLILKTFNIPHRYLLALFMAFQPIYFVNSSCTIDYIWALALLLAGYSVLLKKQTVLGGILFGLAVGARMSSCLFVLAVVIAHFIVGKDDKYRTLFAGVIAAVTGALLYIPSFIYAGKTMAFFTYYMPDFNLSGYLGRFVYKNIYFLGLQMFIAVIVSMPVIVRGFRKNRKEFDRLPVILSVLIIVFFELLFIKIPLENEYLLPILPFLLILLAIALKYRRKLLIVLFLVQLSFNFVNFNIAQPDVPNQATGARVGFWVEEGYVFKDFQHRLFQMEINNDK